MGASTARTTALPASPLARPPPPCRSTPALQPKHRKRQPTDRAEPLRSSRARPPCSRSLLLFLAWLSHSLARPSRRTSWRDGEGVRDSVRQSTRGYARRWMGVLGAGGLWPLPAHFRDQTARYNSLFDAALERRMQRTTPRLGPGGAMGCWDTPPPDLCGGIPPSPAFNGCWKSGRGQGFARSTSCPLW